MPPLSPSSSIALDAAAQALGVSLREGLLWEVFRPLAHAINNPLQGALGAVELAGLDATRIDRGLVPKGGPLTPQLAPASEGILATARILAAMQTFVRAEDDGARSWAEAFEAVALLAATVAAHDHLDLSSPAFESAQASVALPGWAASTVALALVHQHRHANALTLEQTEADGEVVLQGRGVGPPVEPDARLAAFIGAAGLRFGFESGSGVHGFAWRLVGWLPWY